MYECICPRNPRALPPGPLKRFHEMQLNNEVPCYDVTLLVIVLPRPDVLESDRTRGFRFQQPFMYTGHTEQHIPATAMQPAVMLRTSFTGGPPVDRSASDGSSGLLSVPSKNPASSWPRGPLSADAPSPLLLADVVIALRQSGHMCALTHQKRLLTVSVSSET